MTAVHDLTLAIYPNAIGFGYAVMLNPRNPIDVGVAKVHPIDNLVCLKRIRSLLDKFHPRAIVLQELEGKHSRKSPRVKRLIKDIRRLAENLGVRVYTYSREQIKLVFSEFDRQAVSKYQVAHVIGRYLPELSHRLPKYRKAWMAEDYNMGLFDAVSLLITHYYVEE